MNEISLLMMVMFYLFAGLMHFLKPRVYLRIMPPWLPFPLALVYISGLIEILAGILLAFPYTRSSGAWLIIALLIAVFPANIQMTMNLRHHRFFWLTVLRLPIQLALIWWAWLYIG